MSLAPARQAGLVYGLVGGVLLLAALALIGLGLTRMAASSEATPFRSACQGDDACRAALAERLPGLKTLPGGALPALHEALTRSAPVLPADATLAACQSTGAPESCALDPAKLKPGEAGALIAILDAHSLTVTRQGRACRDLEACATRALAALGEYGFDPVQLQAALQRTSYPLPPVLKACADADPAAIRAACHAEALLKAAPEPLTVALEQDWKSGGAQARLPQPADPQVETTKNALWAALGAALGMLVVGAAWLAVTMVGGPDGKGRLAPAAQSEFTPAGAPARPPQAARPAFEPPPAPARAGVRSRATAAPPVAIAPVADAQEDAPTAAFVEQSRQAPASPPAASRRSGLAPSARAAQAAPPEALLTFQTALSIPEDAASFAQMAAEEGARLSPRFDQGARLAAGAILAAHRMRGDRPAEAHARTYEALVLALAGADHRLVWPRSGAPITAEMETADDGDLLSHTVEAVVRPGLVDPEGALILRPRVRAR